MANRILALGLVPLLYACSSPDSNPLQTGSGGASAATSANSGSSQASSGAGGATASSSSSSGSSSSGAGGSKDIHDVLAALPGVTVVSDVPGGAPGERLFE